MNRIAKFRLKWLKKNLNSEDWVVRKRAVKALGSIGYPEAVWHLSIALHDRNLEVRQAAVEALGKIGGDTAIDTLITALSDGNRNVREKAREALAKIGRPAVEPLIKKLKSGYSHTRNEVEQTLADIGQPTAEPLINALKQNRDKDIQSSAARILGKIAEPMAVEPLIYTLQDKETSVREAAIEALGNMAAASAVEPLIRILEDSESYILEREAAAVALGKIGDSRAVPPLLEIIKQEYFLHQEKATQALDNLGWKPSNNNQLAFYLVAKREWNQLPSLGKDAVEPLLDFWKHKGWQLHGGILTALAGIKDDRTLDAIIQTLSMAHKSYVRREAAEALGKIRDARVVAPLLNALKDKEWEVQSAAKEALLNDVFDNIKDDTNVVKPLINGLKDDWEVREVALEILEKIGKPALLPLINVLKKDRHGHARQYAARLLGNIRDPRVIAPLIRALQDPFLDVRQEAAQALGEIGDNQAIVPLITALEDQEGSVRCQAAESLGKIKDSKAIPPLINALKDQETDVRQEAVKALSKIVSRDTAKPLIDALKDEHYFVSKTISDLLRQILDSQTAGPLIRFLKETNIDVRQRAANILTRIGWKPANNGERALYLVAKQDWDQLPPLGKDAVGPLIHVLEDKDFNVRYDAIIALGQIKDDRTIATLAGIISNCDIDYRLQVEAVEVLENSGDKRAVAPLVDALKHNKDQNVRQAAAKALGKIKDPGAIAPLIEALKDEDSFVKSSAITALGEIAPNQAVEPLINLLEEKGGRFRNMVLEALSKIGDPRTKEPAFQALTNEYYYTREQAAKLLDKIGWKPSNNNERIRYFVAKREWDQLPGVTSGEIDTTPFIIALEDSYHDREGLIMVLGQIGKPWADDILLPLLETNSPVRKTAAMALAKIRDPRAVVPLTHLMKDPIPHNRCILVDCLGKIGTPAVDALIEALNDESSFVRISAIQALVKIKDPGAIVPLTHALKDTDFNVRVKTVEALAELADPRAVVPLINFLRDNNLHLREKTVEAIVKSTDIRSMVTLVHLLEDRQDEVTTRALQKMSGKQPAQGHMFFCTTCCSRAERHRLKLSTMKRLDYYACRNCHDTINLIQGVNQITLLLDRSRKDKEASARHEKTLIINWFKKKVPVDFDEIWIKEADDFDVEELVMKLRNDPDDKRRKRLSSITVYLSPHLKLTPAKMNLLNDNFKIVKWINKKK